ncbi:MAG: SET domain-containing protein [bacterium]|nr:SET domain-containing protein [bacterium]
MLEEFVYVGSSPFGRGVFSSRSFTLGENILSFYGLLLSFEQAVKLGDLECYSLQIGHKLYMDLEAPGRLINHSCSPNAGISKGRDLVALRDIVYGEELF